MHLVSSGGAAGPAQQALFMPMLTRMPKARVKAVVVALAPNTVPGAVLRQHGVPVYDVALSRERFSIGAFGQLLKTLRSFKPDIIQAWGLTAAIVSHWLRARSDWEVKTIWSPTPTAPLSRKPGFIDTRKLALAVQLSKRADKIVYTSEAAASAHRRAGFPEEGYAIVPLGVDPTRFKPDFAVRRKVREQLNLDHDAFVIGMLAPFQPEYDHATLLKAAGELIKTNPKVSVLLAGHGVQRGNGALTALVGGGTLGTRTQLLGEWSDVAAFYNACDVACSSATTDHLRTSLIAAMLCGVPCVATGMGAQGEVLGHFGVAVEPGSPAAFIRGITRVMQLTPEKRAYMAQNARKHALTNFVVVRSLQKYLQLYYDMLGRKLAAESSVPVPKVEETVPVAKPEEPPAPKPEPAISSKSVAMHELSDPDSLESRTPAAPASVPPKTEQTESSDGDVLQMFEQAIATQTSRARAPETERARGVAEDVGDLLAPEVLQQAPAIQASATQPEQVTSAATNAAPSLEASAHVREADAKSADSIDIDLSATGTLRIPSDLIFAPASASAPARPAANASASGSALETNPSLSAPSAEPRDVVAPANKMPDVLADSSTVPALAVDQILSNPAPARTNPPPADDAVQLDLLDGTHSERKATG